MKNVTVVGAGFGGLSAAALLAKEGFKVTVLEKNAEPGGRSSIYSENGFHFDMGPSWYLMPDIYEKFYLEFGKKVEDFFKLEKLDPSYRIFIYEDEFFDLRADLEKNYQLFDSFEPHGGDKLREYLESSKELYEFSIEEMLYKDYKSVLDLLNGKLLIKSYKLHLWENLEDYINKQFASEEARKILKYAIGFLGGAPKNTPSFYHLVSHADLAMGVWYPQGGMRKVVQSLYELAQSYGVEFKFNEPVEKINIHENMVNKVDTTEDSYEPDLVIVTADYPHAELDLINPNNQTYNQKYWEERVISPSAMVIYLGVDFKVDKLLHHNLFLNKDWETGFDYIFDPKKAEWPKHPSYYVNVPSKTDRTAAPEGSDTIYILIPLAPGMEDNSDLRENLFNNILDDLESKIGVNIREHVVVKKLFAINDFKERYNAYKGTAFGLTHTLRQTALWRPAHQSKKAKNLYYSGQYTHPGIGVPMVMVSSQIIAREIIGKYGNNEMKNKKKNSKN